MTNVTEHKYLDDASQAAPLLQKMPVWEIRHKKEIRDYTAYE